MERRRKAWRDLAERFGGRLVRLSIHGEGDAGDGAAGWIEGRAEDVVAILDGIDGLAVDLAGRVVELAGDGSADAARATLDALERLCVATGSSIDCLDVDYPGDLDDARDALRSGTPEDAARRMLETDALHVVCLRLRGYSLASIGHLLAENQGLSPERVQRAITRAEVAIGFLRGAVPEHGDPASPVDQWAPQIAGGEVVNAPDHPSEGFGTWSALHRPGSWEWSTPYGEGVRERLKAAGWRFEREAEPLSHRVRWVR